MEVRQITLEERAAYEKLSARCFTYPYQEEKAQWAAEPAWMQQQYRGAFDATGKLCSGMVQWAFGCHFGGQETKLLGIGGVVSNPCVRRGGGVRALFAEGLPRARREGYTFSALYPFKHAFYRKFGYELVQISREASFDPQELRDDLQGAAEITFVQPEDEKVCGAVKEIYEAYARPRNLSIHRNDDLWARLLKGTSLEKMKYLYLLRDAQGSPMAYWLGEVQTKEGRKGLRMLDMAWRTPEGLEAIFAMLRGSNEFCFITLRVSADTEVRFFLKEPYHMEEKTCCNGMVRILDAGRALAMMPAPVLPGKCLIRVKDEMIAENNGLFLVTGDGRELLVESADEGEAEVETNIGGLALLVLGRFNLAQFRMHRRGTVRQMTPFAQMLFAGANTFMHDAY